MRRAVATLLCAATVCFPAVGHAADVVVTIKPIHSIVASVMKGVGDPKLLMDGGVSPHSYALKPSDVSAIRGAKVLVFVSRDLETFLDKTLKGLPAGVSVMELGQLDGLTRHAMREGGVFAGHDHGGHGHGHSHGKKGHSHGKKKSGNGEVFDAHIWLDPANAAVIAKAVAEQLAKAWPDKAQAMKANAARFASDMEALSRTLADELSGVKDRPFIVFHDAYQYFEKRFGLTTAGSVTLSPERKPSAKRISALRKIVRDRKAVCVFAEPQFEPKVIQSIIERTPARKAVLDPLGAAVPAGSDHYVTLLRNLAQSVRSCLAG